MHSRAEAIESQFQRCSRPSRRCCCRCRAHCSFGELPFFLHLCDLPCVSCLRLDNRCMQVQGAEAALQAMVLRFGPQLMTGLPRLPELISTGLAPSQSLEHGSLDQQAAMEALQVLRVTGPLMPDELQPQVRQWLQQLELALRHECSIVRALAAKCAAALAKANPAACLPLLLRWAVPTSSLPGTSSLDHVPKRGGHGPAAMQAVGLDTSRWRIL